jgi:hypothetical protein
MKGAQVYPSSGASVGSAVSYSTAASSPSRPSRAQLNRYPSLSAVSKSEIPRAIVIQSVDPDEEDYHEYAHECDDHTIDTYISTPIRNQTLFNGDYEGSYPNELRRNSYGSLPKLSSQASLTRKNSQQDMGSTSTMPFLTSKNSQHELLPPMGSRRNLLRHPSQEFDMVQDVTPDKKWSVKRDCFVEMGSRYNAAMEVAADEVGCRQFLASHQWPLGIQNMLIRNVKKIPLRIFICDDSGMCLVWRLIFPDLFCRINDNERWQTVIWRRKHN